MSSNRKVISKKEKKPEEERFTKSIEKLQLELKQTIDSLKCLEVVQASSRGGDVRVLCRCHNKADWLNILYRFLERERGRDWYSFIGQKYLIWEGNLTAAWVLIFSADDLDEAIQEIRKLLLDVRAEIGGIQTRSARKPPAGPSMVTVPLPSNAGFESRLQERTGNVGQGGTTAGGRNVRTVSLSRGR